MIFHANALTLSLVGVYKVGRADCETLLHLDNLA